MKRKIEKYLSVEFDSDTIRPLDKGEKKMLQLMKKARNKNGSVNWNLLKKLIKEDGKLGK